MRDVDDIKFVSLCLRLKLVNLLLSLSVLPLHHALVLFHINSRVFCSDFITMIVRLNGTRFDCFLCNASNFDSPYASRLFFFM